MIIKRVSAYPSKNNISSAKISRNSTTVTNLELKNDCFTSGQKTLTFQGIGGGGFGLGIGELAALALASATGVGLPATLALLVAGGASGAAIGSKVGDAISNNDDD